MLQNVQLHSTWSLSHQLSVSLCVIFCSQNSLARKLFLIYFFPAQMKSFWFYFYIERTTDHMMKYTIQTIRFVYCKRFFFVSLRQSRDYGLSICKPNYGRTNWFFFASFFPHKFVVIHLNTERRVLLKWDFDIFKLKNSHFPRIQSNFSRKWFCCQRFELNQMRP